MALDEAVLVREMLEEVAARASPIALHSFSFTCRSFSSSFTFSDNPLFPSFEDLLIEAAKEGYVEYLRYWCEEKGDGGGGGGGEGGGRGKRLNLRTDLAIELGQMAALRGQLSFFSYLFSHLPSLFTERRSTFLLHAIFGGHLDMVRHLLSQGFFLSPLSLSLLSLRFKGEEKLEEEVKKAHENQGPLFEACAFSQAYAVGEGEKVKITIPLPLILILLLFLFLYSYPNSSFLLHLPSLISFLS